MNGLRIIMLCSIAFAAVQWGSRDVRFGVTILFVAFVAYLAGARWGWGPPWWVKGLTKDRPECSLCRKTIKGTDYRFRGAGIGDRQAEDGLVYEHFPRCPK